MKRTIIVLSMAFVLVASNLTATALATANQDKPAAVAPKKSQDKKKPPESKAAFSVDEDVWVRFIDESSHHMKEALVCFEKEDFKGAGHQLWLGAGYLRISAGNAVGESQEALLASARELEGLSSYARSAKIKSTKGLESAFGRAEHALAIQTQIKAKSAFAKKQSVKGGFYLRSAMNHIEKGTRWTGVEMEEEEAEMAEMVRKLGTKLSVGAEYSANEAGKCMNWTNSAITKLGKNIKPMSATMTSDKPKK